MALARLGKRLHRGWEIGSLAARLTRPWWPAYIPMVLRAGRLCRRRRFTPTEAFRLGLFLPGDAAAAGKCISRKHLTKIQKRLNPESAAAAVRDKAAFYRRCLHLGIPIPALYAVFGGPDSSWRPAGGALTDRESWVRFIGSELPDEFIIKPAVGAYGRGVRRLTRTRTGFVDHRGAACTACDVYDAMAGDSEFDRFILQQRLHNAPELVELTGADALETIRLITLASADGACRIVHGHFKPIVGNHIVDTVIDGLTGNVEAPIDLTDGTLGPANRIAGDGRGVRTIRRHPATGREFAGFPLPAWADACRLVRLSAPRLLPLRALGWDVALTPEGPVVVEANVWWDPPNQHENIGALVEALRAEIA